MTGEVTESPWPAWANRAFGGHGSGPSAGARFFVSATRQPGQPPRPSGSSFAASGTQAGSSRARQGGQPARGPTTFPPTTSPTPTSNAGRDRAETSPRMLPYLARLLGGKREHSSSSYYLHIHTSPRLPACLRRQSRPKSQSAAARGRVFEMTRRPPRKPPAPDFYTFARGLTCHTYLPTVQTNAHRKTTIEAYRISLGRCFPRPILARGPSASNAARRDLRAPWSATPLKGLA